MDVALIYYKLLAPTPWLALPRATSSQGPGLFLEVRVTHHPYIDFAIALRQLKRAIMKEIKPLIVPVWIIKHRRKKDKDNGR